MCQTFGSFEKKRAPAAYQAASAMAIQKIKLLILCGPTGTGKTHLANSIIMDAIAKDISAKLIRAKDWLDDLKEAIRQDINFNTCDSDILRNATISIPVLAIDELKWRTEFDEETMDDLVTRRLAEERRTVITSNNTVQDLSETFPRITSRASDPRVGNIVWIAAGDYREYLKNQRGHDAD